MKKVIILTIFLHYFVFPTGVSAKIDNLQPWTTVVGESSGDKFGYAQTNSGDFNGDGYNDIVITASDYDSDLDAGRVYVFFGRNNFEFENVVDADVIIDAEDNGDLLGVFNTEFSDLNGDGMDDLVVGAGGYDHNSTWEQGRVYVFYGGSHLTDLNASEADVKIDSVVDNQNRLGFYISDGGDIDGNGYDDLLLANRFAENDFVGKVGLFFGDSSGIDSGLFDTVAEITYTGRYERDYLHNVAGVGDLNGDGYDDFTIVSQSNEGQTYQDKDQKGHVKLFYGEE